MPASSIVGRATRHLTGVGLQAVLIAAIVIVGVLALAVVYRPGERLLAQDGVYAAKALSGHITVETPVAYGETTTASVNPGGSGTYVRLRCYAPDMSGEFVYGRFFDVDSAAHATLGPLKSTLWTSGPGTCVAEEGYFTRNGLGRWVGLLASTTFHVGA